MLTRDVGLGRRGTESLVDVLEHVREALLRLALHRHGDLVKSCQAGKEINLID